MNKKKPSLLQEIVRTAAFVALYVLVSNARSVEPNPFVPGAAVAINTVIPVLAGVLYGARTGFFTGFLGTLANTLVISALNPRGNPEPGLLVEYELLLLVPYSVMGFLAGYLRRWFPTFLVAGSLAVGYALSILMSLFVPPFFGAAPLVTVKALGNLEFWYAILYEIFVGIIAVTVMTALYRMSFGNAAPRRNRR